MTLTPEQYKTAAFGARMSKPVRDNLTSAVASAWKAIQEHPNSSFNACKYETYKERRDLHLTAAIHATFADSELLPQILTSWGEFQGTYISAVKKGMYKARDAVKKEWEAFGGDLLALEKLERERDVLWERMQEGKPKRDDVTKLHSLETQIAAKEQYRDAGNKARNAIDAVPKVIEDLEKLAALGLETIHYHILGPDEFTAQLKDGTYAGIPFEPFEVVPLGVQSIFVKGSGAAAKAVVNPSDKPKELVALLELKAHIDAYEADKKFNSSKVRKELPDGYFFSAGIVGTYLREVPDLFGIRSGENYAFFKEAKPPLSEVEFLSKIIEKLRPMDQGAVNGFYLNWALGELRKEPIGYDGFSIDTVLELVRGYGYPITRSAAGVNLGKFSERYDVESVELSGDKGRGYRFATVLPTDEMRETVARAVERNGFKPFTRDELCRNIFEAGEKISIRVLEDVLDTSDTLEQPSKGSYQTIARPQSAGEQLRGADAEASLDQVF